MDHDDRVAQAQDDFWWKMERWRRWVSVRSNEEAALAIAYDAWIFAAKLPGDPHKEWVDAEKMKPKAVTVLVRGSKFGDTVGLGHWGADGWHVQFFGENVLIYKKMITHWRYIPGLEDDNE